VAEPFVVVASAEVLGAFVDEAGLLDPASFLAVVG
jgi:hypothetical protein